MPGPNPAAKAPPLSIRRRRGWWIGLAAAVGLTGAGAAVAQAPAPPALTAALPAPMLTADQAALLVKTLGEADSHGIDLAGLTPPGLEAMMRSPDPAARRQGEAQLRTAILAYARAQHGLRIPTSAFLDDWAVRPEPYDAEREFDAALTQNRLAEWLASQPPPFQGYIGLRGALARYRAIAAQGGWGAVSDGPALKLGDNSPRVVQLRQRVAREDAGLNAADPSPVFDQPLADAAARFQARNGMKPDGIVGKPTLALLNAPVEGRIDQVLANMERWRWLPRAWPATRVEVNIPGATLSYFVDNRLVAAMKAVAGRPSDKSPMLHSDIHSVVLNPPWNVPATIAAKELFPKGAAYLAREGYVVITLENGGRRLQQKAGPKSALGQVKFDFENRFGVYLHDTPNQAAFDRDNRALSHGCIRLEHPVALAKLLFQGDVDWTEQKIDETLASGDTTRAKLGHTYPLFILYWTAFVDQTGQLNFRKDIYDWDSRVVGLLDAGLRRS